MAFVIANAVNKLDHSLLSKILINLDKIQSICECEKSPHKCYVDFGDDGLMIKESIDEICANSFSLDHE